MKKLNALSLADRRFDEDLRTVVETIRSRRIWDDLVDAVRGRRARLSGMALGLLMFAASWVAVFDHFGIDTRLATATMWLASLAQTAEWSGNVVLVVINERTEAALGRDFDAGWRAEHAALIDRVLAAKARSLAFDMVLVQAGDAQANDALAAALARARGRLPVVFATAGRTASSPQMKALNEQAVTGVTCAGRKMGLARSLPLAVHRVSDDSLLPSLALAAFSAGGRIELLDEVRQRVGVLQLPEDKVVSVAYFSSEKVRSAQVDCPVIKPGDRVLSQLIDPSILRALDPPQRSLAYESVLRGDPAALRALAGRVVLVGVLRGGEDRLDVPGNTQRWGAEMIAAQIDGLFRRQAIRSPGPLIQGAGNIGLGLAGALIVIGLHRRSRGGVLLALLAAAILFWAGAVAWYRIEGQLISLPYGWASLALGAWAAKFILKGKPT